MNPRWKRRPAGSTWGDFGPDDQRGRLNLLTREKVLQGVAEVREGLAFCLSWPLDFPGDAKLNARRHPPRLQPTSRDGVPNMNFPLARLHPGATDVISDDAAFIHLEYSTHWNSLAQLGQMFDADGDGKAEMVYYNGYRAGEHIVGPVDYRDGGERAVDAEPGARALGVENMATQCVQGRAVMIDLHKHYGNARKLVGYADLMEIMEKDRVVVEAGDFVCLRTGFDRLVLAMDRKPDLAVLDSCCAGLDGGDARLLDWITESGLVSLITDHHAELHSPRRRERERGARLPLHEHCVFKLGVHLGEHWLLSELADWLSQHARYRFLLTAPPLRLPGAVGSPVTPVGTV